MQSVGTLMAHHWPSSHFCTSRNKLKSPLKFHNKNILISTGFFFSIVSHSVDWMVGLKDLSLQTVLIQRNTFLWLVKFIIHYGSTWISLLHSSMPLSSAIRSEFQDNSPGFKRAWAISLQADILRFIQSYYLKCYHAGYHSAYGW